MVSEPENLVSIQLSRCLLRVLSFKRVDFQKTKRISRHKQPKLNFHPEMDRQGRRRRRRHTDGQMRTHIY